MTRTLVRKVLIRERELKTLRHHCLVKSPYGNEKIYDSVEWRPITVVDLTLEILRGEEVDLNHIKNYIKKIAPYADSMYDKRYYYWDFCILDGMVMTRPDSGGRTRFEPFGWAVLKKHFEK